MFKSYFIQGMELETQFSSEGQGSQWLPSLRMRKSGWSWSACCCGDSSDDWPSPLLTGGGDGGGRRTWRCPGSSPCPCQQIDVQSQRSLHHFFGPLWAFFGPLWGLLWVFFGTVSGLLGLFQAFFYSLKARLRNSITITPFRDISQLNSLRVALSLHTLVRFLRLSRSMATVKLFFLLQCGGLRSRARKPFFRSALPRMVHLLRTFDATPTRYTPGRPLSRDVFICFLL